MWKDGKVNAGQQFVSSDNRYLFFTSGEQREGDIYWIYAEVIQELRPIT
jgi:hypothetical protein